MRFSKGMHSGHLSFLVKELVHLIFLFSFFFFSCLFLSFLFFLMMNPFFHWNLPFLISWILYCGIWRFAREILFRSRRICWSFFRNNITLCSMFFFFKKIFLSNQSINFFPDQLVPDPISEIHIIAKSNSASLSWKTPARATSYQVYIVLPDIRVPINNGEGLDITTNQVLLNGVIFLVITLVFNFNEKKKKIK